MLLSAIQALVLLAAPSAKGQPAGALDASAAAADAAQPCSGDATAAMTTEARALFLKGVQHYRRKQWDKAYAAFVTAWALKKHYSVAGNLAEVEVQLGKYRDAAEHFDYYVREIPADRVELRRRAESQLAEVRKKVAAATLDVDTSGADVLVDGKAIGKAPINGEIFLEPGERYIEARLEGHDTASQTLAAKPGETHAVRLSLRREAAASSVIGTGQAGAAPAPPLAATEAPPPSRDSTSPARIDRPSLVPVFVGGAVAVIGVGAGLLFHSAASSNESDAEALRQRIAPAGGCGQGSPVADCAELSDTNFSLERNRNWSTASFVVGGAGTAFAIGYFVWRELHTQDGSFSSVIERSRSRGPRLGLAVAGSRSAQLHIAGNF